MEELVLPEFLMLGLAWESFEIIAVMVFFANFVTMVLPNKSKHPWLQVILDSLNFLAMNILSNANRLYPQRFPSSKKKRKYKRSKRGVDDRVAGDKP